VHPFLRRFMLRFQSLLFREHDEMGDPTIANCILGRLVHHADGIEMRGESMRKKRNRPPNANILTGGKSNSHVFLWRSLALAFPRFASPVDI
jgi:hypothetical protein